MVKSDLLATQLEEHGIETIVICSLLLFSSSGPAATIIHRFLYEADKPRDDSKVADRQGAWQALVEKYGGNTNATRRVIHAAC